MSATRYLITAVLLFLGSTAFAQVNYVLNPDFETYSSCPTNLDEVRKATYWSGVDSVGINSCIPEYCNTCGTDISCTVPQSGYFYQYPRSGNGMVQSQVYLDDDISLSIPTYRDYLQGRLYKKLIAGKSYCVSFYVSLEECSDYAIKEIGAYLDNGAIDTIHNCGYPQTRYTPQVVSSTLVTDTAGWTKIEGSFVSDGTEKFITIGCFRDKAHTTFATVPVNWILTGPGAWYLIDDVSVIESDLKADAGQDRHIGRGDSTYIGRPKEVGLECSWSVLGSTAIIGKGAGIWVKPSTNTSYVVTQTLCGQVKKDTVRVDVWGLGVNSISGQTQQYFLSPNPSDGTVQLLQGVADAKPVNMVVRNTIGELVYSSSLQFVGGKVEVSLSDLPSGMYYIVLRDGAGGCYSLRFVRR